jgi:hypothetical protein
MTELLTDGASGFLPGVPLSLDCLDMAGQLGARGVLLIGVLHRIFPIFCRRCFGDA